MKVLMRVLLLFAGKAKGKIIFAIVQQYAMCYAIITKTV
jgi:hypothetical protein